MKLVILELPDDEARALARMCKRTGRTGHGDCERLASRFDCGEEADAMWAAVQKLQKALAEAGFAPR